MLEPEKEEAYHRTPDLTQQEWKCKGGNRRDIQKVDYTGNTVFGT